MARKNFWSTSRTKSELLNLSNDPKSGQNYRSDLPNGPGAPRRLHRSTITITVKLRGENVPPLWTECSEISHVMWTLAWHGTLVGSILRLSIPNLIEIIAQSSASFGSLVEVYNIIICVAPKRDISRFVCVCVWGWL